MKIIVGKIVVKKLLTKGKLFFCRLAKQLISFVDLKFNKSSLDVGSEVSESEPQQQTVTYLWPSLCLKLE